MAQKTIWTRIPTILAAVVLLLLFVLPINASADMYIETDAELPTDTPTETPAPVYDTHYDEKIGELTVYMHIVNAERGTLDLLPVLRDAAEKSAAVNIDAGPVKVYVSKKAVPALVLSGQETLIFKIEDLCPDEDAERDEGDTEMARYRVTIGDENADLPKDSIRLRFRYRAIDPTLSCAYAVGADGRETALRSAYLDGLVSFYPEAFGEFVVREAPPEAGMPKTVLLSVGLFSLVLLASVILLVLLKTGTVRKLYLKRIGKE